MDKSPRTIWIWTHTTLSKFTDLVQSTPNLRILCICGDESHDYFRHPESGRCKAVWPILARSEMVVHISGTLFPLGPRTDAQGTMKMLGGPFTSGYSNDGSKWSVELRKKLRHLFHTEQGRRINWDVITFRTLVTPFHLRRTLASKYSDVGKDGTIHQRWIIPRTFARPKPIVVTPEPCNYEREARMQMSGVFQECLLPTGELDLKVLKSRSTTVMIMNWIGPKLYRRYLDAGGSSQVKAERVAGEAVLWDGLDERSGTKRVALLHDLLHDCVHVRKEGFIIVTESIALVKLAVVVCHVCIIPLTALRYAKRPWHSKSA